MGFWSELLKPQPAPRRRTRRASAPRPVRPTPTCVDCGGTIHRKPGPGRAPLRCATCRDSTRAAGPKWKLAPGALERVQAHFGLEHPIYVRRSTGRTLRGKYRGLLPGFMVAKRLDRCTEVHVITISSALDPDTASRVLLHEACHAQQREQDDLVHLRASRQLAAYGDRRRNRRAYEAYRDHPIEVEARAAEADAARLAPLIVAG
ncbi:MAG: hypothetical protein ACR2JV_00025 [Gaiellales bacterium]